MIAIAHLDEVDSTNTEAMRRAAAGERGPLWITARRQTAGRGRAGRAWGTPDGNLAATLLFVPACEPAGLAGLSLVAGVAMHAAVARHMGVPGGAVVPGGTITGSTAGAPADALAAAARGPLAASLRLKWPNDLLLDGAKLSGCLIESSAFAAEVVAAIGIGINVAVAPDVPGRAVTCLAAQGATVSAEALASDLGRELGHWLAVWERGSGFGQIREAWLARAGSPGEPLTVTAGSGRLVGRFAGLDMDGALLVGTDDGGIRRITFGDVAIGG